MASGKINTKSALAPSPAPAAPAAASGGGKRKASGGKKRKSGSMKRKSGKKTVRGGDIQAPERYQTQMVPEPTVVFSNDPRTRAARAMYPGVYTPPFTLNTMLANTDDTGNVMKLASQIGARGSETLGDGTVVPARAWIFPGHDATVTDFVLMRLIESLKRPGFSGLDPDFTY
jgi:hypothetical protein